MSQPIISERNLHKSRLRDISLDLGGKKSLGILGGSGIGKICAY